MYFQKNFRIKPRNSSFHIPANARYNKDLFPEKEKDYLCKDWRYGDLLIIPFYDRNRKFSGCLGMDEPIFEDAISPEALLPLELFATEVSIALENRNLFNSLLESKEKYKNLFESAFPIFVVEELSI